MRPPSKRAHALPLPGCSWPLCSCCLPVAERWIRPLEVGESHVVALDEIGRETMTVTLIDANHCPGSVMFLFEGYFGSILHTGDFRYTPNMQHDLALKNSKLINVIYLDNTNCHPAMVLPSRQKASEQIKEVIRAHPNHHVKIGIYSLGKESLLVELAKEFLTWIVVSPRKLELIKLLGLEDVFTSEEKEGWIHAVDCSEICQATMIRWNQRYPTIAILPTSRTVKRNHPNVYLVPYSDHSSFQELVEFVAWLKPCSIIPVVKNAVCQSYFQQYLTSPNDSSVESVVPESVKRFMQQNRGVQKRPSKLLKLACYHRVPRGVLFESLETCLNESEDNKEAELLQQGFPKPLRKSVPCSKGGCAGNSPGCEEQKQLSVALKNLETQSVFSPEQSPFVESTNRPKGNIGSQFENCQSGVKLQHKHTLSWDEGDARSSPSGSVNLGQLTLEDCVFSPSLYNIQNDKWGTFTPWKDLTFQLNDKWTPQSLCHEYDLFPLNSSKQWSSQDFDKQVENCMKRGRQSKCVEGVEL